jgi:hypothetical protein
MSRLASIWREQAMPKSEVAGMVDVSFRQSVKYENSSVDLRFSALVGLAQRGSHSDAPMQGCLGDNRGIERRTEDSR